MYVSNQCIGLFSVQGEELHNFCTNFNVVKNVFESFENKQDTKSNNKLPAPSKRDIREKHYSDEVKLRFGRYNEKTYRHGVPYSGKVGLNKFTNY